MNDTRYSEQDRKGNGGTFVRGIEPQTTFLYEISDQ